jgi:hypothetical protein
MPTGIGQARARQAWRGPSASTFLPRFEARAVSVLIAETE